MDQSETVKKKRAEYGEGYYKKYALNTENHFRFIHRSGRRLHISGIIMKRFIRPYFLPMKGKRTMRWMEAIFE